MSSNSTTSTSSDSRSRTMSNTPARLPSLNQLAARININTNPSSTSSTSDTASPLEGGSPTAAPRPRLAAFALRTSSNASVSSLGGASASSGDSMAVNPGGTSTRSGSPMTVSTTASVASSGDGDVLTPVEGGESLTSEKLEKLNETTGGTAPAPEKKTIKGYKNIPSLDAITARLAKTRALSIDGSAKPPEPEMIEDPKTPGIPMKAPEHPLQYSWTIYHDTKAKYPYTPATASTGLSSATPSSGANGTDSTTPSQPSSASATTTDFSGPPQPPESTDYEAGLTVIGTFDSVESFCRYFNWLKPPSKLERNSNYHLFKAGIKPMWEDPANAEGGKWVLTMKNNPQLLDRCWSWVAMALVGEELEEGGDEICGAVVSLRSKVDRIQVWTRKKDDVEKLNGIGKKLVKLLDVGEKDGIGLEFQYNTDERVVPNKFLSIQAMPSTGYRASFQGPPGSGYGAGGFGGTGGGVPLGRTGHHAHSQSVSGADGAQTPGPDGQQPQQPLSAGGTFGSFAVGGTNAWRARRG